MCIFLDTLLKPLKASCCPQKTSCYAPQIFRIFLVWLYKPPSFTFHLWLQPQRSAVHSLNRQWLGFPAWALHPQFPSKYSQVWSVIVISHCSWTLKTSVPKCESRSVVSDSLRPHGLYSPWNSPGQNTGVDSLSLLLGIFPTQGMHPGLPHCRWILYQLSHKGSPLSQRGPG